MTDQERWERDATLYGWKMPYAPWWKRQPIIRHVRAWLGAIAVGRHDAFWGALGMVRSGYDHWVLYGIATGQERSEP